MSNSIHAKAQSS